MVGPTGQTRNMKQSFPRTSGVPSCKQLLATFSPPPFEAIKFPAKLKASSNHGNSRCNDAKYNHTTSAACYVLGKWILCHESNVLIVLSIQIHRYNMYLLKGIKWQNLV